MKARRSRGGGGIRRLSENEKALVERNMGLVGLHIRRQVPQSQSSRSARDFDDLFQEGCLGLIRAVRSYDASRGIPFTTFALPRIRFAVGSAIRDEAQPFRVPRKNDRQRRGGSAYPLVHTPQSRRCSLERYAVDPRNPLRCQCPGRPTLGDRLRERYDLAVKSASEAEFRRLRVHSGRRQLIDQLVEHRFRVAEPDEKVPLRQIARDIDSSYTRVLQCDRRLRERVRRILATDLEFWRLRTLARRVPDGIEGFIDDSVRAELLQSSAEGFVQKLILAKPRARALVLRELLPGRGQVSVEGVKELFLALPRPTADELLARLDERL